MATAFHNSERCFRRYENVIGQIVQRYPQEIKFQCVKRSSSTDAARLQDALNSFRTNNWLSDKIDRQRFVDEVYRNITISARGDYVVIGPKRPPQVDIVSTSSYDKVAGSVSYPSQEQITLAIQCIEQNVVTWPIELTELTPEQIDFINGEISHCFNVATKVEGNTIILI